MHRLSSTDFCANADIHNLIKYNKNSREILLGGNK